MLRRLAELAGVWGLGFGAAVAARKHRYTPNRTYRDRACLERYVHGDEGGADVESTMGAGAKVADAPQPVATYERLGADGVPVGLRLAWSHGAVRLAWDTGSCSRASL